MGPASPFLVYMAAAFAEIAGCFTFWRWARAGGLALWLAPGVACVVVFAFLLTRIDSDTAGRAYAAYGGVYITASLLWLRVVEERTPDVWEISGAAVCVTGAAIILFGPRSA